MVQNVNGWYKERACRNVPVEVFFPTFGEYDEAKRVCADCAVKQECLDYAMSFEIDLYGVFGGLTPNERYQLRAEREPTVVKIRV